MAPPPMARRPWDIPPLYFALAILLMILLHFALPIVRVVPGHGRSSAWSYARRDPARDLGRAPVQAGRHRGPPVRASTALVEDGPFRFTRNPMYLGLLLVLAGLFVLLGTVSPLIVLPAFFWVLQPRFVVHEEAHMQTHFGTRYEDYRRRVRRWL